MGAGELAISGTNAERVSIAKSSGSGSGSVTEKIISESDSEAESQSIQTFKLIYPDILAEGLETNNVTLTGSVAEVNAILDQLTFTANQNSGGTASVLINAIDDTELAALETVTLDLVVTDNTPPRPGGEITLAGAVTEGQTANTTFNIVTSNLNEDGPDPNSIRILNVNGGTLANVELGSDTSPISMTPVTNDSGVITGYKHQFSFTAGSDQESNASFTYVLVDPTTSSNSLPSEAFITITPDNDQPILSGGSTTRVYNENDSALILSRDVVIRDVDSDNLSQAVITIANASSSDKVNYEGNFGH